MQEVVQNNHPIWQHGTLAGFVYVLCIMMFVLIASVITPIIIAAYFMQVGPFAEHNPGDNHTTVMSIQEITNDVTFEDDDFDF